MRAIYQQSIDLQDIKLTYYTIGHGKPLLFLHGGRVRARTFRKLLLSLSEDYSVIAPDIPGYGDSGTPKEIWSFVEYAQFFDAFLQQIGEDNVTVVGYSMGGGIALNLAAQSKHASKLVLVDSSGLRLPTIKPSHHDMRRLSFYLTRPQYVTSLAVLVRDYAQFVWKHRSDRSHMQHIRQRCSNTSYDTAFSRISVPTLILWGESDWIYPPVVAQSFKKRISRATLKFVPGNHDWPVYDPLLLKQLMV